MLRAEVILCFWSHFNIALALSGVCSEFCTHLPPKPVSFDRHPAKAQTLGPKDCAGGRARGRGGGNGDQADLLFHGKGLAGAKPAWLLLKAAGCTPHPPTPLFFQKPSLLAGGGNSSGGSFPLGWRKLEAM